MFEAKFIWYHRKPFIFFSVDQIDLIQKGIQYNYMIKYQRDKLSVLKNQQNLLCVIFTENLLVRQKNQNSFVFLRPKDKRNEQSNDVEIFQIISDSQGLLEILKNRENQKKRNYGSILSYNPSKQIKTSLLSGESPQQKFRGFLNLAVIILIVHHIRNIIDNFYKFGNQLKNTPSSFFPINSILAIASLPIFIGICFYLHKLFFKRIISRKTNIILNIINICLLLLFDVMYSRKYKPQPITAVTITMLTLIIILKIISYIQVNNEIYKKWELIKSIKTNQYYAEILGKQQILDQYLQVIINNKNSLHTLINFKKLIYFIAAPTLCYQIEYPRTLRIRKVWLFKRIVQFIVITCFIAILIFQYIKPQLHQAFKMYKTNQYTYFFMFEQLLILSVPNVLTWIAGFYAFFHVWLNILAELLYFGDRNFYQDWWNCKDLEEYWKLWNLPVHNWCLRHIYTPLLKKGYSKVFANIFVFFISAVAHEFMVSIPLGIASIYAFIAMMIQAPIILIQKKLESTLNLKNSELGNLSFWVSFCFVGQPICVFLYYFLYLSKQQVVV